jgi:release factor glutamine methyltransferase
MIEPQKRRPLTSPLKDDVALKRILAIANNAPFPVYTPSDDSLLMIDAITHLPLSGRRVLDMGTGSGILGLYCAMQGAKVTASDIDEAALEQTDRAAAVLGLQIELRLSDLFEKIQEQFDLILFNPPYLPSVGFNDRSVDGGPAGTMLADRFLENLPSHLGASAEALLLLSSVNDPASVQRRHGNIDFSTIAKKQLFFEELQVLLVRLRDDLTV